MFNRALFSLFVLTTTASAAQLFVDGYGRTNYGQVNAGTYYNQAVAGDTLYDSQSTPSTSGGRYSNFSYSARAAFGNLGFQYQMEAACNVLGCGVERIDGYMRVGSYDPLFIVGAQSGVLAIDIMFEGTASGNYDADYAHLYYWIGNGNNFSIYSQVSLGLQYPPYLLQNNYGSNVAYQFVGPLHVFSGTAYIPFANGTATLTQMMGGQWDCSAGDPCNYNFNFYNSAKVGNARILDETGTTLIPGATITSESGYDYTQPIADASVPEPGSLIAVISGLIYLLRRHLT